MSDFVPAVRLLQWLAALTPQGRPRDMQPRRCHGTLSQKLYLPTAVGINVLWSTGEL